MTMHTDIQVEVIYALPEQAWRMQLLLPAGATVVEAIAAAAALAQALPLSEWLLGPQPVAIFGRAAEPSTPLQDGDRVELLRPLLADPKQARRQRARAKPIG